MKKVKEFTKFRILDASAYCVRDLTPYSFAITILPWWCQLLVYLLLFWTQLLVSLLGTSWWWTQLYCVLLGDISRWRTQLCISLLGISWRWTWLPFAFLGISRWRIQLLVCLLRLLWVRQIPTRFRSIWRLCRWWSANDYLRVLGLIVSWFTTIFIRIQLVNARDWGDAGDRWLLKTSKVMPKFTTTFITIVIHIYHMHIYTTI